LTFTPQEAVKVLGQKFLLQEGIAGISHHSQQLIVYVETPEAASKIPQTLMGYPVKTIISGKFRTLALPPAKTGKTLTGILANRTLRFRPVCGGVSIGSILITAGTNATRVFDRNTGMRLFLSNRHVFWGEKGERVTQPGRYDGATENDVVATVERWVELKLPPDANLVDCALALPLSQDLVSDEVLDIGVVNGVEEARVGMRIKKSGRCFTKDTLILTNPDGPKTIEELSVGSLVYSLNEATLKLEKNRVKNIIYQAVRPVYLLKTENRMVKVTDNHPFLTVERTYCKKPMKINCHFKNQFGSCGINTYERMAKVIQYKLVWKELKDLKVGDLIVVLRSISDYTERIGENMARLLGFMVADGCIDFRPKINNRVYLYCSSREEAEKYANLLTSVFPEELKLGKCLNCGYVWKGKNPSSCVKCFSHHIEILSKEKRQPTITKTKNLWLVGYNTSKAKFLKKLIYGPNKQKQVPNLIWRLPLNERIAFLEGYIDGDGYRYDEKQWYVGTTNEKLAKQIWMLCTISGLRVSNLYSRVKTGYSKRVMWEFKIYPKSGIKSLKAVLANSNKVLHYPHLYEDLTILPDLEFEPVRSIKFVGYEETYDIEVEGSHNFIGNGILMHNSCGLAEATITDINACVKVEGYDFGEAVFEDTVISTFCGLAGDSGSIAVSADTNAAVGLLFAGSDSLTCFNKMTNVVNLLNVDIPTVAVRPPIRAPAMSYVQLPFAFGLLFLMASQKF
jgi:intein/homing endonuclease